MQINFTAILNDLLAIGKDAVIDNLGTLEKDGVEYVTNLIDRLQLVANDYKERSDWNFAKERIKEEGDIFLAELRSLEVLEEATAERVLNNVIQWAQGYVVGILGN